MQRRIEDEQVRDDGGRGAPDVGGGWRGFIRRSAIARCALASLAWLACYLLLLLPAILALKHADDNGKKLVQLYAEATGLASILAVAWWVARRFEGRSLASTGLCPDRRTLQLATGTVAGSMLVVLALVLLEVAGSLVYQHMGPASLGWFAIVALGVLMNAALQEIWIRGILQRILSERYGTIVGILASSIVFVAIHGGALHGNLLAVVNLLLASFLFAFAYRWSGQLWLPIGLHCGWNVTLGPVLGLVVSGRSDSILWQPFRLDGDPLFTGGRFGLEGGLAATVAVIVGMLLVPLLAPSDRSAA